MNKKIKSNIINTKNYFKSLQAQVRLWLLRRNHRASCLVPGAGSATVEASLILPFFLFALCSLFAVGQLLMTESIVRFAASTALQRCCNTAGCIRYGKEEESCRQVFFEVIDRSAINMALISEGFSVKQEKDRMGQEIRMTVSYAYRVPYPPVSRFTLKKRITLRQRIFSGYVEHGNYAEDSGRTVYIAENGTVYHTHADCSYIYIRITGRHAIQGMLQSSALRPCRKCCRGRKVPGSIFITPGGSHYHVRLSCSGLSRSVKAVPYSEVAGMRKCSRCMSRDRQVSERQ